MRKYMTRAEDVFELEESGLKSYASAKDVLVGIYVRIPIGMKRFLRDEAASTGDSMSALVRHALRAVYESADDDSLESE